MQPYPRSPDLVWPGQLHGTGRLSARAVDTGFPTVVRRLCLGPGCGGVWVSLTLPVLAGVLGGCVCVRFVVLLLFCRLFMVFVVGLWFRPAYATCVVACALRLPPAVSGSGVRCGRACWGLGFGYTPPLLGGVLGCVCARAPVPRGLLHFLVGVAVRGCVFVRAPRLFPAFPGWGAVCGRACWAGVSAVPRLSWLGCRGVFFVLFFLGVSWFGFVVSVAGCPRPGRCGPCPPVPFLLGWSAGSLFFPAWCVSACFGVPFPGGPLFLAWCCRFLLGGPPVPVWGSCPWCLLGWGSGRLLWCWRAVWWLWAVLSPPPLPSLFSFSGGGLPVPPSAFPGLAHTLARIQCGLPGCCWRLPSAWPCSGPMGRVGYVHVGLGAPSCRVRSWLCRLGGCARRLRVALG